MTESNTSGGFSDAVDISTQRRWRLPRRVGFAVAAYMIGLGFFASLVPSPLYQDYQSMWDFSSLTLTLVYATYAIGVLAALLLAGRASDDLGRRPVLLTALAGLTISTVMFIYASDTWWLFVARGLQGVATGLAISAASAALLDFQTRRDPVTVAVANGVASNAGLGLGLLVTSALIETVASPLVVPYVLLLVLIGLGTLGVLLLPQPGTGRLLVHLRLERPRVPAAAARPFLLAALAVLSSWSIAGVNFSLGPQLGAELFDSDSPIMANAGIYVLVGTAAITQAVLGRTAPWRAATGGSLALAAGMVVLAAGTVGDSGWVYLAGSFISGFGFGLSFLGGLRVLVGAIPPTHRAGVMSAFYVVGYGALSVPAVLAGLVVTSAGLMETFAILALAAAVLALAVAVEAWRTRPIARTAVG